MHRTGTDWLVGLVIDSVMTSSVGQEESDLRMLLYSSGFMRIVSLFPYSGKCQPFHGNKRSTYNPYVSLLV